MDHGKEREKQKRIEKTRNSILGIGASVIITAIIKGVMGGDVSGQPTNYEDFQERDRNK